VNTLPKKSYGVYKDAYPVVICRVK